MSNHTRRDFLRLLTGSTAVLVLSDLEQIGELLVPKRKIFPAAWPTTPYLHEVYAFDIEVYEQQLWRDHLSFWRGLYSKLQTEGEL